MGSCYLGGDIAEDLTTYKTEELLRKYRNGTVSYRLVGGLNMFNGTQSSPSAADTDQSYQTITKHSPDHLTSIFTCFLFLLQNIRGSINSIYTSRTLKIQIIRTALERSVRK